MELESKRTNNIHTRTLCSETGCASYIAYTVPIATGTGTSRRIAS